MNWFNNLSLKFKLIFLLVFLTGSMLSVYGAIALHDFENDKIAYVRDTSLAQSRSSALQMYAEIGYVVDRIKFLMRGYSDIENTFHPFSASIFTQENQFSALMSYRHETTDGSYKQVAILKSNRFNDAILDEIKSVTKTLISQTLDNEMTIYKLKSDAQWVLGLKMTRQQQEPLIIFAALESSHFMNLFQVEQMQNTYLINSRGELIISPSHVKHKINDAQLKLAINQALGGVQKIKAPEWAGEFSQTGKKEDAWIISLAKLNLGQMSILSAVPRKAALENAKKIMLKSALFLGLLLCVTIFLSVLSSTSLTSSLKKLLRATSEIANGNFDVQVQIQGKDEIGSLSSGFNRMANEISRLMLETAEKARMEGELNTARLVQSTLFPNASFIESDIQIHGFYQPASECSGDWWYYKKIGNKTLFCIGDATGHGVPAALLTAAARSAASAIETFPELPISEIMTIFNKAIYNTAKGQVMMTLFLGSYNHQTGEITYCNASHEPPFLVPNKEQVKKKDINLLNEAIGPRLGESFESQYESTTVSLAEGDRLLLYTDGVTELKNKTGDMWGERSLIKLLIAETNEKMPALHTVDRISNELTEFRNEHPLHDDVTYFILTKQKAA